MLQVEAIHKSFEDFMAVNGASLTVGKGEIVAVMGLKESTTGDTLCDPSQPILFPAVEIPEPSITFAIEPKARGDEDKISNALARIAEEDAAIRYNRDPQTKQLLLCKRTMVLHLRVKVQPVSFPITGRIRLSSLLEMNEVIQSEVICSIIQSLTRKVT
jgi:hypothetical protein